MILLLLACAHVSLPLPSDAMVAVAPAGATLESLNAGYALVVDRCGSCHAPPRPVVTAAPSWPSALATMSKKAKITADQAALIDAYLRAGQALPPEPPAP